MGRWFNNGGVAIAFGDFVADIPHAHRMAREKSYCPSNGRCYFAQYDGNVVCVDPVTATVVGIITTGFSGSNSIQAMAYLPFRNKILVIGPAYVPEGDIFSVVDYRLINCADNSVGSPIRITGPLAISSEFHCNDFSVDADDTDKVWLAGFTCYGYIANPDLGVTTGFISDGSDELDAMGQAYGIVNSGSLAHIIGSNGINVFDYNAPAFVAVRSCGFDSESRVAFNRGTDNKYYASLVDGLVYEHAATIAITAYAPSHIIDCDIANVGPIILDFNGPPNRIYNYDGGTDGLRQSRLLTAYPTFGHKWTQIIGARSSHRMILTTHLATTAAENYFRVLEAGV